MIDRAALLEILRRYEVRHHNRASTEAGVPRYALFADGRQIGEPASRPTISQRREESMASALIDYFGRGA